MLLLLLMALGGAPKAGCAEGCNSEMAQCGERCNGSDACMGRCERRLRPCTDKCVGQETRADAAKKKGKMPCGGSIDGKIVTCTADEEKANLESVKDYKKMGLCKNEDGDIAECPPEKPADKKAAEKK